MIVDAAPDVSQEFLDLALIAQDAALNAPDDAVQYMVQMVPIHLQYDPTHDQRVAGGCLNCTYLGLWTDQDPRPSQHGHIWIFEHGITAVSKDVLGQIYQTIIHEMGHALQRDHVLDGMHARGLEPAYSPLVQHVYGWAAQSLPRPRG